MGCQGKCNPRSCCQPGQTPKWLLKVEYLAKCKQADADGDGGYFFMLGDSDQNLRNKDPLKKCLEQRM